MTVICESCKPFVLALAQRLFLAAECLSIRAEKKRRGAVMPELEVDEFLNRLRSQGVPADKLAEILEGQALRLRRIGVKVNRPDPINPTGPKGK